MEPKNRIIFAAVSAVVLALTSVIIKYLTNFFNAKEQEEETKTNIILQPLFYLLAGIFMVIGYIAILACFWILPAVDNANRELPMILLVHFAFGAPFVIGVFSIFLRLNWRIEIHEDGFSFRNVFRVTKQYSFEEITEVDTGRAYRYYKGKKKILAISMLQPNCFLLAEAFSKWKSKKRIASNE